jgi:uncharacterized membrane protein YhhN
MTYVACVELIVVLNPVFIHLVFKRADSFAYFKNIYNSGAMTYVACFELIADAAEELSIPMCSFTLSTSFVMMMAMSAWLDVVTAHQV